MTGTGSELTRALDALEQAAVLWLIGEGHFADVVRAACELLVAGGEGDALAALAGEPANEPAYVQDMDDALHAALAEQGRPLPLQHTPEAQEAATVAMAKRALHGVSPQDLAAWAHRAIGHAGVPMAQPLVDLDDRYDTLGYSSDLRATLDREVLAYCEAVAAST